MFAVVAGDDEVEIEPQLVEHGPVVDDALDGLLVAERLRLTHLMPDDGIPHQLVGEVEVPLVPHHEVVQLDDFSCGSSHLNTSAASVSRRWWPPRAPPSAYTTAASAPA